jgi:hypothetical protein
MSYLKCFACSAAVLLSFGIASTTLAQATKPATDYPDSRIDIYAGYGYIHPVNSDINQYKYQPVSNINTTVSVAGYFNHYFGIQAEGSYFSGNGEHLSNFPNTSLAAAGAPTVPPRSRSSGATASPPAPASTTSSPSSITISLSASSRLTSTTATSTTAPSPEPPSTAQPSPITVAKAASPPTSSPVVWLAASVAQHPSRPSSTAAPSLRRTPTPAIRSPSPAT